MPVKNAPKAKHLKQEGREQELSAALSGLSLQGVGQDSKRKAEGVANQELYMYTVSQCNSEDPTDHS